MIRRCLSALFCFLLLLTSFPPVIPARTGADSALSLADQYRRALRVDPDNLTLHYFLGISLLTEERVKEALGEFRRAYPAFADSIEMNYNLGLAYSLAGDPDSALLYFDQAETLGAANHPGVYRLADAYYNLGLAYLEKDALAEAGRVLAKSLSLDPARSEVHRMLGDLLARQGQIDLALEQFALFLERHPDDRPAREYVYALLFNRAQELLQRDDVAAARENLHKALDAMPGSPLAHYYLGFLDYRQGHHEAAVESLILAADGSDDEMLQSATAMLYNCSLRMLEKGKAREALAAITPLLERDNAGAREYYLAGNIHLALKEYYQAHSCYQKVLALDPEHRGAAINLVATTTGAVDELVAKGRSLYREERHRQALEHFEKALALHPAEPRAVAYREQIRTEMKERSTALFDRAEEAEREGALRAALERIRQGRSLAPDNPRGAALEERILAAMHQEMELAIEKAETLLAENLLPEAERAFTRVLELAPGNEAARQGRERVATLRREGALQATNLGNKALEEGRLGEARKAFEEALRLQPELDASREGLAKTSALYSTMIAEEMQWGRRAMSGGELLQARKHFLKALELRDDPEIRAGLATLDKALKERIDALAGFAATALERNDFSSARRHYEKILELAPQHPAAAEGLTRVATLASAAKSRKLSEADEHLSAKRFQQALGGYREVLDIDPANRKALAGLEQGRSELRGEMEKLLTAGTAALDQGSFSAAEDAFARVLLLDPYQQDAREGLDRIEQLRSSGDTSGDEHRLYLRGIELYTRGRYQEAVTTWKRVLFLAPGHEKALMNIEKAQRKLRQIREYRNG